MIQITFNAKAVNILATSLPLMLPKFLGAIRSAMAVQNDATIGIIRRYNRGRGPYSVSENRLGHVTGRWARSIRQTIPRVVGNSVVGGIGSNVSYAAVHEFGYAGSENVSAHRRKVQSRNIGKSGKLGVRAGSAVASGVAMVKAHTRSMNFPARAPISTQIFLRSTQYKTAFSNAIVRTWNESRRGGAT